TRAAPESRRPARSGPYWIDGWRFQRRSLQREHHLVLQQVWVPGHRRRAAGWAEAKPAVEADCGVPAADDVQPQPLVAAGPSPIADRVDKRVGNAPPGGFRAHP